MNRQTSYPQVDRRNDLSLEEFREAYLHRQRPVVITDAIDHWPARSLWSFDHFRERFGDVRVAVHRYDEEREFTPDTVTEMTLRDYIAGITTKDWKEFPYYLRDNWRIFHRYPELLAQHDVPRYFFDWFRFLPPFMRLPYPRIFIGPRGAITPLHADIWGTHAWLSQLVGKEALAALLARSAQAAIRLRCALRSAGPSSASALSRGSSAGSRYRPRRHYLGAGELEPLGAFARSRNFAHIQLHGAWLLSPASRAPSSLPSRTAGCAKPSRRVCALTRSKRFWRHR